MVIKTDLEKSFPFRLMWLPTTDDPSRIVNSVIAWCLIFWRTSTHLDRTIVRAMFTKLSRSHLRKLTPSRIVHSEANPKTFSD